MDFSPRHELPLLTPGRRSHDEPVRYMLQQAFPELHVCETAVAQLLAPVRTRRFKLRNRVAAAREFGAFALRRRQPLTHFVPRTSIYFGAVKSAAELRLSRSEHPFSFQTESLFDASAPGVPHYVYTAHAALASRDYPGFDNRDVLPPAWTKLERRIYRNARLVFTHSEHTRRWLTDAYDCPPDKVVCVFSGGNAPAPSSAPRLDVARYARKHILFAGLRWDFKGGPLLMAAFRQVLERHPDATLTIVGCNPQVDVERCDVVGVVPVEEMPRHYASASVFCLPTTKEAFGQVFVEALAHGLPIVAPRFGSIPELVVDGQTGYLVEPADPRGLAERLIALLDDPARCAELGNGAYDLARSRYNWRTTGVLIRRSVERTLDSRLGSDAALFEQLSVADRRSRT